MSLYPELEPFDQFDLRVDDLHTLHVERCGNPDGRPVLVLHGGPGGGCSPALRRFFNPAHWQVILFDQRGAGRSTPYADVRQNSLADLIADIERLRTHLGLSGWALFGGSWGATLALHYGLAFPEQVHGMVLRGIFLARPEDLAWLYEDGGAARMKPDAWEAFVAPLPEAERGQPLPAYYQRLHENSPAARQWAKHWAGWEAACATLRTLPEVVTGFGQAAWALARMETHYFAGPGMDGAAPILPRMAALKAVPAWLVHGRYDLVCQPGQAWALHQHWPGSVMQWVDAAGHSAMEPALRDALVEAVESLYHKLEAS